MAAKPYTLSKRTQSILLAISHALVNEPEDLKIKDKENEIIRRCEQTIREFAFVFRFAFVLGVFFFDLCVVLFGFGFRRFVKLERKKQQQFLALCLESRIGVLRNIVSGLRGLVMISYFSHPDVWAYIGYDPVGHVEKKQKLRAGFLLKPQNNRTRNFECRNNNDKSEALCLKP